MIQVFAEEEFKSEITLRRRMVQSDCCSSGEREELCERDSKARNIYNPPSALSLSHCFPSIHLSIHSIRSIGLMPFLLLLLLLHLGSIAHHSIPFFGIWPMCSYKSPLFLQPPAESPAAVEEPIQRGYEPGNRANPL